MNSLRQAAAGAVDGCARHRETMEVAATQIDLAMREAQIPIERVGLAIGRMSELLSEPAPRPEVGASPEAGGPRQCAAAQRDQQLREQLVVCIENLQVFDRLSQHLVLIRNLLVGDAAARLASEQGDAYWAGVCQSFRARLLSDRQAALFDLIVSDAMPADGAQARGEYESQGSVELF